MEGAEGVEAVILWMAHPVSAPTTDGIYANIARATRWLAYLRATRPDDTIIAPWVTWVEIELARDGRELPTTREKGLQDCEAVVARCDGLVVVGGRLTAGMARECGAFLRATLGRGFFLDLLHLGNEPPEVA
jgi:hypothetical protein